MDTLDDGFRLKANAQYTKFPARVDVTIAYADGSGKPAWSEYDFRLSDLSIKAENCTAEGSENRLRIADWSDNSVIEVTGFDARRELDTRIRTEGNASED